MMHNGYNSTENSVVDNKGFTITKLEINFPLNINYFNKLIFISASIGKFYEMINITITSKCKFINILINS